MTLQAVISTVRIFLVDDLEVWQQRIRSILDTRLDLQIIGAASDGLEAVQIAEELKPDLILLDIGLPKLNGIEAARRIRSASPKSKIIFVTQESSADIVQQAFSLGACGYVVKIDAGRELLAAITAVLRGERFIAVRFAGHDFTGASDALDPSLWNNDRIALAALTLPQKPKSARSHEVQFYPDETSFLDGFSQFIGASLKAANAAIVVATESHRDSLLIRLQTLGLDIAAAIEDGRYISLDAADTVSTCMVNGLPDPVRFTKITSELIVRAAKAAKGQQRRVVACGECAPLLWAQGNAEGTIRLERLWDQIARSHGVEILCGYLLSSFQIDLGSYVFEKICAEHSAVHSR